MPGNRQGRKAPTASKAEQRSTIASVGTSAEPQRSVQRRFVRKAFGREIVDIDGAEFIECEFRSTTLRYGGGEVPRIIKATSSPGSGVQQVVRETFAAVFAN